MCVRSCLCNQCRRKQQCSSCIYNDLHKNVDCYNTGVIECEYYISFKSK